jgi:DNA-directed RNA polymerase specialized sigma24 family protein
MKRILIDSARRRLLREGRPGQEELLPALPDAALEQRVLALDCALERLEQVDPQLSRLVELRFLLGLEVEEVARTLGISTAGVQRGWRSARAFLKRAIETEDGDAP